MPEDVDDVEVLKQQLSGDPPDALVEEIAETVVDQMAESFPELSLTSRPMGVVLSEFRARKLEAVDSESQYERKLDYLEIYLLDEVGVETTEELTSKDVERYIRWRKYDSLEREEPLADTTLQDDMYLFREFVEYLVDHGLAPVRFEKSVEIPEVKYQQGEGVDEKKLDPEIANAALEYLRRYEYAGVEHISMELMCHVGPRKGGLHGRDVSHFDYEDEILQFEHQESTALKKNEASEREVTLYGDLPEMIQEYIEVQRLSVTDSEGREPLLTKGDGRIAPSTLQKIAYKWTRPCKVGLDCPHDRDPDDCEAAQQNNKAYKCPSSRAPHHIRKGYITDQRSNGVSPRGIDQRCDVSPRVQDIHYDLPDQTEERERFEDEFRNADDDPNSGFSHD